MINNIYKYSSLLCKQSTVINTQQFLMSYSNKNFQVCPACRVRTPNRVYGKPNKERRDQPSMFELLTWQGNAYQQNEHNRQASPQHPSDKDCIYRQNSQPFIHTNVNGWSGHSNCGCEMVRNNKQLSEQKNIQNVKNERNDKNQKKYDRIMQRENSKSQTNIKNLGGRYQKYMVTENQERIRSNSKKDIDDNQSKQSKRVIEPSSNKNKLRKVQSAKCFPKPVKALAKQQQELPKITQKEIQEQIKKFKQETRWIPNTSFTTYFGKPPFENYGSKNTHTLTGGLLYGNYMYTHNVFPHRGVHSPKNMQSYPTALNKAQSQGTLYPIPPRTLSNFPIKVNQNNEPAINEPTSSIFPDKNNFGIMKINSPQLQQIPKFCLRTHEKTVHTREPYYYQRQADENDNKGVTCETNYQTLLGKTTGKKVKMVGIKI